MLRYVLTFLLGMCGDAQRLWTVTAGKLSVDVHLACACICVYVHADLSDACKDTNTFSLCVCVQAVSPSRQCNYALPSHPTLLFSLRAQRASATYAFL